MNDIYFNILLGSDIDDIVINCQANTESLKLCQTKHFWMAKFKHDRLPYLISSFDHMKDYVAAYQLIKSYKLESQTILAIHDVESRRIVDQMRYMIIPIYKDQWTIMTQFLNLDVIYDSNSTYDISVVKNEHYELSLNVDGFTHEPVTKTYNQMLNLLINLLYQNPSAEILDQESMKYILPYDYDVDHADEDTKRINYKRLGIRDALMT